MLSLEDLLARPVFAVDARVATWADVIAAARASGGWDATEAAAAAGLTPWPRPLQQVWMPRSRRMSRGGGARGA